MKTGIMGGTFNPIHNGHLILAEHVMEEFGLDEIWFMPNGNPPHKRPEQTGIRTGDRLAMVKLAIEGIPRFFLQTYEAEKRTVSYSYETMEHLRDACPERTFYYIIGADSLFQVETWKHPERFLRSCTMIAAKREHRETDDALESQIRHLKERYKTVILFSRAPVFEVSSSKIREMVKRGADIHHLVPPSVASYIYNHHLYREDIEDEQRNS